MSDNVVTLSGGPLVNERRESFLRSVAASFDNYVERYGFEPDALVYVLNGITKPSLIAWDIRGPSQSGVTSVLAVAAVHCMAEAQIGRQGLP